MATNGNTIVSVETMRNSDAAAIAGGIPSSDLVLRAAAAVFESVDWNAPVLIVCGSGNNAADGYALALFLHKSGIKTAVYRASQHFSDDGLELYMLCLKSGVGIEVGENFSSYACIVDCLLGTGFHGPLKPEYRKIINEINRSALLGSYIVALDINSGLNGNSGIGECFVRSDITVSIGSFKPGHFLNMAGDAMKRKINADIGIDIIGEEYKLFSSSDALKMLMPRPHYSNKSDFGYIALVGGCLEYSGAVRLAGMANCSARSGAGVVTVAVPRPMAYMIAENVLECTVYPLFDFENSSKELIDQNLSLIESEMSYLCRRYRLIAFGMGVGLGYAARKRLEYLIKNYEGLLLIDADGISLFSSLPDEVKKTCRADLIFTPHLKEFSRLSGMSMERIQENPVRAALDFSNKFNCTLLLKGPSTVIAGKGKIYISDRGCSGMATAGSGDVLSGCLSALIASNSSDIAFASAAGAYICGLAGELAAEEYGDISLIARDTASFIPKAIDAIRSGKINDKQ